MLYGRQYGIYGDLLYIYIYALCPYMQPKFHTKGSTAEQRSLSTVMSALRAAVERNHKGMKNWSKNNYNRSFKVRHAQNSLINRTSVFFHSIKTFKLK